MAKTCPDLKCPKHGVKLQGIYCPACGTKAILLPLFPFAIYVKPKAFLGGCGILSGAGIFVVLLILAIIPGIQSCDQQDCLRRQQHQQIIDRLPEQWQALYAAMQSAGLQNGADVLKKANGDGWISQGQELQKYPPLPGEAVGLFMDLCNNWYKENAAALLLSKVNKNTIAEKP